MAKKSGKTAKTTAKKAPLKTANKSTAKKSASNKPKTTIRIKPRRLKTPQYKSWRIQKRIKHPVALPSVWRLTKLTYKTLWANKGLFAGITLIYGLLNLAISQSLSGATDVTTIKQALDGVSTGHFGAVGSGISIFALLVGSAGNSTSASAGAYQLFFGLVASLAVIWALRQVLSGTRLRVRDAYYRGMYPLVPFILVLIVVVMQLIPAIIGSSMYALVINNGIAVYFIEKLLWALFYGLLALLSLYMISSSLFALYIVTLPDMTPMKALRSARSLVLHRRWTVLRKILCLPIILLLAAAIVMLPIITWFTPLSQLAFFFLSMLGLVVVHTYMYSLYRELLNE